MESVVEAEMVWLGVIATCIGIMAIAHSFLGERNIVRPIIERMVWSEKGKGADFSNGTVRFVWHIITVAWFGFAILLLAPVLGVENSSAFVSTIVALTALVTAGFAFFYTGGRHLSWVAFLIVAAACLAPFI